MAEIIDAALFTAGKPCDLDDDPSKYLEKLEEWYEHISLLVDSIGVKDKTQKLRLTLLWGRKDFRKFTRDAGLTDEDTLGAAIISTYQCQAGGERGIGRGFGIFQKLL